MTRQEILDLYFLDARSKLIDLAAFLDRVERAPGQDDYRLLALREALRVVIGKEPGKARGVLMALSDPTSQPIAAAHTKSASGAWPAPDKNEQVRS